MEHLEDEESITIVKDILDNDERDLADKVADEILNKDKEEQKRLLIFVFMFVLLTLFVSFTGFSLFKINQGTNNNVINAGSVLFSFNESSNSINMVNTYPMTDELGKKLSGDGEYFEFTISTKIDSSDLDKITYELSLTPVVEENTLDSKYVRVYLEENGKGVEINGNEVNLFSSLPDSKIERLSKQSKLLYKKTVNSRELYTYKFRMWVDPSYNVDNVSRIFKCFVNVDAY